MVDKGQSFKASGSIKNIVLNKTRRPLTHVAWVLRAQPLYRSMVLYADDQYWPHLCMLTVDICFFVFVFVFSIKRSREAGFSPKLFWFSGVGHHTNTFGKIPILSILKEHLGTLKVYHVYMILSILDIILKLDKKLSYP